MANKNPHEAHEALRNKFKNDPQFKEEHRLRMIEASKKSVLKRKLMQTQNEAIKKALQEGSIEDI